MFYGRVLGMLEAQEGFKRFTMDEVVGGVGGLAVAVVADGVFNAEYLSSMTMAEGIGVLAAFVITGTLVGRGLVSWIRNRRHNRAIQAKADQGLIELQDWANTH
jgi:hypothetical protein